MRRMSIVAAALFPVAAVAFHVQIAATGWSRYSQKWISECSDIGGTILGRFGDYLQSYAGEGKTYYIAFGSAKYENCFVRFLPGGEMMLRAATCEPNYTGVYGARDFEATAAVSLGTFGYRYGNFLDTRWDNAVITMMGDPYSLVFNDTSKDLTVNNKSIKAGAAELLPFPIYLVMDELENVSFNDLKSGIPIVPRKDPISGKIYNNGYYLLSWTGDIRISDGTAPSREPPMEGLLFGDLDAGSQMHILYSDVSTNGAPIFADGVAITTNFNLVVWWDFDQLEWGNPEAKINGVVVCDDHSTGHIIEYDISARGKAYGGRRKAYFTMSQTPSSGYDGGVCVMRCWDASVGGGTAGFRNAPANHRAEVAAGLGVAKFKLTFDIYSGDWSVEAVQ